MLVAKVAMVVSRERAEAERDGVVEECLSHCSPVYKRPLSAVSNASGLRASVREKARLVVDVVSDAGLPIYARPGPLIQVAGSFRWSMKLVDACMYAAWQRSTRRLHLRAVPSSRVLLTFLISVSTCP